jgi:hypothetical protein
MKGSLCLGSEGELILGANDIAIEMVDVQRFVYIVGSIGLARRRCQGDQKIFGANSPRLAFINVIPLHLRIANLIIRPPRSNEFDSARAPLLTPSGRCPTY